MQSRIFIIKKGFITTSENLEYVLDSIYREGQRSDQHEKIMSGFPIVCSQQVMKRMTTIEIVAELEKNNDQFMIQLRNLQLLKKKNHMLFGTQDGRMLYWLELIKI